MVFLPLFLLGIFCLSWEPASYNAVFRFRRNFASQICYLLFLGPASVTMFFAIQVNRFWLWTCPTSLGYLVWKHVKTIFGRRQGPLAILSRLLAKPPWSLGFQSFLWAFARQRNQATGSRTCFWLVCDVDRPDPPGDSWLYPRGRLIYVGWAWRTLAYVPYIKTKW